MPCKMGEYDTFEECVSKNQDKDDPAAYCGAIKQKLEGKGEMGAYTSANVDAIPGHTAVKKPIEEHKTAGFEWDCNYMGCTCKSTILEVKSNLTPEQKPDFDSEWTVRFVGVTDAPSNGQKFDPVYMKSIVDEANKKIADWKKGVGPGIVLYDRNNHRPESHGDKIGWVDGLVYHVNDTSTRKKVHWVEVIGKTIKPDFNRLLYYQNAGKNLLDGWSIGFKHPTPDSFDIIDGGIKSTKRADIVHWVASLDPADPMGNKILGISAKSKKTETAESETANQDETEGDKLTEKTQADKAEEEEELYQKNSKGEFVKVSKAKAEEMFKQKVGGEEEEKLAKKTLELDAREIDLNLDVLVKSTKLTPAEKEEWKAILVKTAPEARAAVYAHLEKKTVVVDPATGEPAATTQQTPMITKTAAEQDAELHNKSGKNDKVEIVKTRLTLVPGNEELIKRIGTGHKVAFDTVTGKKVVS